MKYIFIFLFIIGGINIAYCVPQLTSYTVLANFLQDGNIKVYNTGEVEIYARLSASRNYLLSGGSYESVDMDVNFVMNYNGSLHVLKTVKLTTSDFDGAFLKSSYDVKISIPQNLKNGSFMVQYKYKDLDPRSNNYNQTFGPYNLSKIYQTINVSPVTPPGTVPVYSYFSQEGNDHYSTTAETIGGLGSYWKKDGINFYAFNYQAPGTVPIYSYINPNTPDHFSSRFVMTDPYWTLEGIGFYAYDAPGEKRAPVYSYINKDKSDHFISPDPNVASSYWINEGIAFYSPIN